MEQMGFSFADVAAAPEDLSGAGAGAARPLDDGRWRTWVTSIIESKSGYAALQADVDRFEEALAAVRYIASAKAASYACAIRGERLPVDGWPGGPAGEHLKVIARARIDVNTIPMAPSEFACVGLVSGGAASGQPSAVS